MKRRLFDWIELPNRRWAATAYAAAVRNVELVEIFEIEYIVL